MVPKYLSNDRWLAVAPVLHGKQGDPGCHGRDNRQFLEAVFWVVRTRSPWRNLPEEYGKWYTTYTRYRRWEKNGVWPQVVAALVAHDGACDFYFDPAKGLCWAPQPAAGKPAMSAVTRAAA